MKTIIKTSFLTLALLAAGTSAHAEDKALAVGGMALSGCAVGVGISASVGASARGQVKACAVGGAFLGGIAVTAAAAAEAPDEVDMKADDVKTLQDAQDLKNE